ncbi:amino acid adenylation domain-containing protein [Gordonia sp. VNQ95]|uniref:amino acid adenylation domain-containing protein n=1 Tax=Gordonia sp. VNQ95 TaxID=3156619 RepID=UPI0032B42787
MSATGTGVGGIEDVLPLTGLQEAIVYHSTRPRTDGSHDPYLILADIDLADHVTIDADLPTRVIAAVTTVMARHASLRTSYTRRRTGAPVARVHTDVAAPVEVCALDAGLDLDALRHRERRRGITLTSPPPFRIILAATEDIPGVTSDGTGTGTGTGTDDHHPPRHHLLIVAHHVALDGWSLHRLVDEIVRALRDEPLPAPADLRDFLRWRASRPDGLDRWRTALSGVRSATRLPLPEIDPAPPVVERRLGTARSARMRAVARDHGASVNTLIQVAWALVLADHTDTDDVIFGAVVSGRDPAVDRVDEMVGMLINTIPVRVRIDPNESVAQLLSRVQREQLALLDQHQCALGDIQASLRLGELFNSVVVFESFPRGPVRPHIEDENSYAATVLVEDDPDIRILFERRTQDGHTVSATLLDRLIRMVGTIVDNAGATAAQLPRSDADASAARGLEGADPVPFVPVSARIAATAQRVPEHVALRVDDHSLTYAELAASADRIAAALTARGLGAESIVAIATRRSVDMVSALLGVLRAGAAYLPIDPGYPAARIDFMLDDATPDLVIDDPMAAALAAGSASDTPGPHPVAVHPDSSAYVVYTSGSTGTPKAVVGTSRALANRIAWAAESWNGAVVLAKSSIAFIDGSTELLGALAAGSTVILADDTTARDATALADLTAEHHVDQITAIPSLAQAITEVGATPTPRRWIVSGEPLVAATRDALASTGAEIINSYGSSEVAGDVTMGRVTTGAITAGTAVAGIRVTILDHLLRPVPAGVAGDIYVGGPQSARGYRNHSGWTATAFVADPDGAGSRLYRTGDRGRIEPDGRLTVLGRADRQVKIRGVRVELGEVESAIADVDGVREAAVRAVTDTAGDTRIDAYVSGRPGLSSVEIVAALSTSLPAAMIPASITILDALPLTPGGKVDRLALPDPADAGSTRSSRGPRTDAEAAVIAAATAVLGRDAGIEDNFFDLGGHSLSATRLLTRLRVATGSRLGIGDVFDHPVLAELAALIDTAQIDTAQSGSGTATPTTPPGPVPGLRPHPLPLSPAQRRLLFQSGVDDSAYTVAFAVRLDAHPGSSIDVGALSDSLTGIVTRHEVLRTRIVDEVPVIDPADRATVAVTEHRGYGEDGNGDDGNGDDGHGRDTEDLVARLIARPYDLSADAVLRADLIHTWQSSAILLLTVHHIAADEWSARRLFDELAAGYNGITVAPPTVQFTDHTVWQLDRLGDPDDPTSLHATQLSHWRDTLDGIPDEMRLPTDRPRPMEPSHRGDQIDRAVPTDLVAALDDRAATSGTTRFMLVHAAVTLALSASGAGDDIVVGTPFAGRTTAAAEELIGMFVNTLALRTDLSGDPTLGEVIDRIRCTDLDAYEHADLPFDAVVAALTPHRSLSRHPVFQTMVQYRDPIAAPYFAGLDATPLFPQTRTAKFDLTFEFVGLTDGLRLRVEYATDLFDRDTTEQLTDRVLYLLEMLAHHPDVRVAALRVPDAPDTVAALPMSSVTAAAAIVQRRTLDGARTLWEVFAHTAAEHADRVALTVGAATLTYREVDDRSAHLAAALIADGLRPGDLVALLLPRGADQVISILAVLRAGGAYVPIDPDYPDERIETILADARPVVIVDADHCARVWASDPGDSVVARPIPVTPDHPAYVIYTSGSTGRPKGVTITHRNVVSLLAATREAIHTGPEDVWTLFHSYAFDFSVWEIWGALSTGARLVIPDRATTRSPADFATLLRDERVTVLNQTPSAFYTLDATLTADPDHADPLDLGALRYLIFGGEALDARRLTTFLRRWPDVRAINMYGITEITVHATLLDIDADSAERSVGSAVGAVLPGFTGRLLDRYLRPVPPGVIGELYLSGPQVARAYLNRPGLSAGRFVADPGGGGGTCYRTGDLFRLTGDGRLLSEGRADSQVKIRGFRIELGEVRAAVAGVSGVRDVVVITRPGPSEGHRLLAYVVTDGIGPDDVRSALATVLPEHMVPAAVIGIDAVPLTTNGKTDVAALPEPHAPGGPASDGVRAPATEAESALLAIFAETLHLPAHEISVDDDFFALGGDSIVSTTLVNRARRAGWCLRTRDVFTHRTIEALAVVAEPITDGDNADTQSGTATAGSGGVIGLLPIMHRLRELGGRIDRHNQSLVVDTPPDATPASITAALQALLDAHEALRMTLNVIAGDVWTLTARAPGDVAATDILEVVASDAHGTVADTIAAVSDACAARLSPTSGRMIAAAHLTPTTSGDPGRLVLVIHHLAVDGVSRRILLDDLAAVHDAGSAADAVRLGDTTNAVRLGDFAAAVAEAALAPELLGEVAHWAAVLAPGGELIPGSPARSGTLAAQRGHVVALDVNTSRAIVTDLPTRLGVGVTSIFLGALRVAATEVTGAGDLVVDTERHGRDTESAGLGHRDLTHTVGWFTTMAPLRLPAADGIDPHAAVVQAERQWQEMPSAGAGFGLLRYLNPQTAMALATMPSASVLLNYLGRFSVGTGGAWQPSAESSALAAVADPDLGVAHPLEVEIVCRDEADGPIISATFRHLSDQVDAETVVRLADRWRTALEDLVAATPPGAEKSGHPDQSPAQSLTHQQTTGVCS